MTDEPSFNNPDIAAHHGELSFVGAPTAVTRLAGRTGTPTPRRRPGWFALAAVVAGAVLAVEAVVFVFDSVTEPAAPATVEHLTTRRPRLESFDRSRVERSAADSPAEEEPPSAAAVVAEVVAGRVGLPAHLRDVEVRVEAAKSPAPRSGQRRNRPTRS